MTIVSASRRTDIPAFYSEWLFNRLAEGWCFSVNPFNSKSRKVVDLDPENVACFVFWTRFSRPMRLRLDELDGRGYRYYFLFTLVDYGRRMEPRLPYFERRLDDFLALSSSVGADRVIWRYDPIIVSPGHPLSFHLETFSALLEKLEGYTSKVIISFVDRYRKSNLTADEQPCDSPVTDPGFAGFMNTISSAAERKGITVQTCAEPAYSEGKAVRPGKCIDDRLIRTCYGLDVQSKKDPGQRKLCRCVKSVDIGSYNTCLFGCRYCYATGRRETAKANWRRHDPLAPSLLP